MTTQLSKLRLVAEELGDGETLRTDCPSCGRKKTFTITREGGGAVYNCYSTHCAFHGAFGINGLALIRVRSEPVKKEFDPYVGALEKLNHEQEAFLEGRIGFGQWHIDRSGVRYAPIEDRYAFPILSPVGRKRGLVLRSYSDGVVRWKALTRMDCAEPHLSWYRNTAKPGRTLIVEDIPSAVRASRFCDSVVAMCGGDLGPDYVREVMDYATDVVWAFDDGATASAIAHHRRYGLCFNSSVVLPLESDLKDLTEEELKEKLASCLTTK